MRIPASWDNKPQIELLKMYLCVGDNALAVTASPEQFQILLNSPQKFDVILLASSHPDHNAAFALFEQVLEMRPECPVVAACLQSEVYRIARFMTAGLRSYMIRDDNCDFLFLILAILEAALKQVETERERLISAQLRKEVQSVRELQESTISKNIQTPDGYRIVAKYESSQIRVLGRKPVTMAGGDYYEAFTLTDSSKRFRGTPAKTMLSSESADCCRRCVTRGQSQPRNAWIAFFRILTLSLRGAGATTIRRYS